MQLLVTHMHVELLFAEHAIAAYQCTMSEIFGVTNHVLCHAFADNDREKMVIIRLSAVQGDLQYLALERRDTDKEALLYNCRSNVQPYGTHCH